ncbi:hypothetical protein [Streptomyces sp. A012304]|uniref:hypothetical protein n=1 Tax=Streptomyces sp. A012304 TaxID=375446 RepID=UPI0022314754|nr:hypothetical protein [Streptomyces sp. A012304]GKQ37866.1 hypothetical protein ALMP_44020 [Streptomyces sp. A012304]
MIDSMAALAAAASTALVAAMATDTWQAARDGMLRVMGRGREDEPAQLAARLDEEAALVRAADDSDAARRSLLPAWRLRLEQFLLAHPEAVDEMDELTRRLTTALPRAQQNWVQHVDARDHGQAFGVQGGNVIIHQEPPADRPDPRP